MGRVYNALLRAERWKDETRPAEQPYAEHNNAATPNAHASRHADATPFPTFDFDDRTYPLFSFDEPAIIPPLESDDNVASFESNWKPGPAPHLYVAPPPPPAPAFTEPSQIINIGSLSIDPHVPALAGGDVLASERYRTLAVRLLNLSGRRKLKTMVVTSAQEGEGKSTVAANLAWVMAKQSGRRVLLIDADLRCPSIARMLGVSPKLGWLDLIEGRSSLPDVAVRLDPNGLYILMPRPVQDARQMGNGSASSQAGVPDALASSGVEKLINDLERHFDLIIIDAPPIIEFADAQRLASIVDGTVMVVRAGHTHHSLVTDALKLVPKERRLGIVLNESQIDEEIAYHSRKKKSGSVRGTKSNR